MPQAMAKSTFDDINSSIHNSYVEVSHESMKKVAKEVHDNISNNDAEVVNTKVSGTVRGKSGVILLSMVL